MANIQFGDEKALDFLISQLRTMSQSGGSLNQGVIKVEFSHSPSSPAIDIFMLPNQAVARVRLCQARLTGDATEFEVKKDV